MSHIRRKTAAVLKDFLTEISRLEAFDAENQRKFAPSGGVKRGLSKRQLYLLTESIFFTAFRSYEGFVRDMFILYCMEKPHSSGKRVRSYLRPKDFEHAESLIQSSMPFLDWINPNTVMERANIYLDEGFPFVLPYGTHLDSLRDFRLIRNHIAHNSKESMDHFKKVLKRHFGTVPLIIPSPGEFLLTTDRRRPGKYKLLVFFDLMKTIANDIV